MKLILIDNLLYLILALGRRRFRGRKVDDYNSASLSLGNMEILDHIKYMFINVFSHNTILTVASRPCQLTDRTLG